MVGLWKNFLTFDWQAAEGAVNSGKSVVIDNTNPGKAARADFIKIAKKKGETQST